MNIEIGFSTSRAWYSRVIRWASRSKVSHTFLVVDLLGQRVVLEEGTFGYAARTLDDLAAHDTIVALVTPKHPVEDGVRASLAELGQPYGYVVLLGMAFVMLGRWLGKKWRNPLASGHAMICSERNTRVLQVSGYPGADALDAAATSPEDLLEFLQRT